MTMRHTSSIPPAPPKGTLPPSMLMPLSESITGRKSDIPSAACVKNEGGLVTLHCGRRFTMGRYSIMYFGVIEDKAMLDVRRDGAFVGEIYVSTGQGGHVNMPMEGKRVAVEVIAADTREAQVMISIKGI